jgi:hypothetical protein
MMIKNKLACLPFAILILFHFTGFATDPAVFRFNYSENFLFDKLNDESTWRKSDRSPSVVNFNNFLYVGYRGGDKRVNVAMIGRVDYADFEDSLRATNKERVLSKPGTYSPALLVVNNKLVVMYIEDGTSLLHYYVVDSAGGLDFRTSEPIDLSLILDDLPAGGSFAGIAAANVSGDNFLGALLYKSPQSGNNKLIALNFRLSSNDRLFAEEEFLLPYTTDFMPSLCALGSGFVGFAITRSADKHPFYFTYHVDSATTSLEYTFSQAVAQEGPVLYQRPGDKVLHLLWSGFDNSISQASFTLDVSKVQVSILTNEDNKMLSKLAPAVFPFNNLFSGILWIGVNKNEFLLGKALAYNHHSWMGDLLNDELLFREISLPGSDKAAMTPDEFSRNIIEQIGDFVDKEVKQCSECNSVFQSYSLEEQLEVGVRYFQTNLRSTNFKTIYGSEITSGYINNINVLEGIIPIPGKCFGLTDLSEILEIIEEFLKENKSEFVVLNIDEIYDIEFTGGKINKILTEVIESKHLKLYKPKDPFHNRFEDLFDVPLRDLRGKLIITSNYEILTDKFPVFRNPFDGNGRFNVRIDRDEGNIDRMIVDQKDFLLDVSDYRRLDWYLTTDKLRAICNYGFLRDCIEVIEDIFSNKTSHNHIWSHIFGCGVQIWEFHHMLEVAPAIAIPAAFGGIEVDIIEGLGNIHKLYGKANKKIPATFQNWQKEGTLRPENRYNILLTSFSSDWISDIVIRDNVYFNSPKLVNPYNKLMDVQVHIRDEFCDMGLKSDIEVTATGLYEPFSFSWLHNNSTDALQESLVEGFYEVEVTDSWGNAVVERVHLQPNFNQFGGLSDVATPVTRHHPRRSHLSYATDCNGLIAGIRSATDFGSWHGQTTVRPVFDAILTRNHVARHFDIQAISPGPAEITLFFTQDDFDRYNAMNPAFLLPTNPVDPSLANMIILHQKGRSASGMWETYSGETETIVLKEDQIQWDDVNQRWSISFRVRTEGGFFLSTDDGLLDNQFLTAKAYGSGRYNTIQWKGRERNTHAYFVEYSFDGDLFFDLSREAAKGFGENEYKVKHTNVLLPPGQQVIYYRIRQISKDFSTIYSEILPVNMSLVTPLLVHPNPAQQFINITSQRECRARVSDMTGGIVMEVQIVVGKNELNIGNWPQGLYILTTDDGEWQKILVQ